MVTVVSGAGYETMGRTWHQGPSAEWRGRAAIINEGTMANVADKDVLSVRSSGELGGEYATERSDNQKCII